MTCNDSNELIRFIMMILSKIPTSRTCCASPLQLLQDVLSARACLASSEAVSKEVGRDDNSSCVVELASRLCDMGYNTAVRKAIGEQGTFVHFR